jgi:hypothetical protein
MPYGPGAKAEVLSILAFRAYPVNRGFETGRVEVTENPVSPELRFNWRKVTCRVVVRCIRLKPCSMPALAWFHRSR